mgnify:CR=1 FL=1
MRDCNERRAEIMRILIARRSETQATLAAELGVSVSNVYRDIVRPHGRLSPRDPARERRLREGGGLVPSAPEHPQQRAAGRPLGSAWRLRCTSGQCTQADAERIWLDAKSTLLPLCKFAALQFGVRLWLEFM